jgi:heat-inducible transcriptional repressor
LDLSPATVRNVMADLEELGLIRAPHTSAGRVPTVQGYRLFVDTLLKVKPLLGEEVSQLREQLRPSTSTEKLVETATSMLSEITHLAGVVTLPRTEFHTVRQVEFLSLSNNQVLVILIMNEHEVQNRIIDTSRRFSQAELQQAANFLTVEFAGKDLRQVRQRLVSELREARTRMDELMAAAIEMAEKTFGEDEEKEEDVVVAGQTHLMEYGELADMEKLRSLFEAFNRKRDILHLLDQSLSAGGVQIFIGEESGYEIFDDLSVVVSPYDKDGEVLGVLGVIGPTRMAYERVIPIVDMTAKLLGAALNPKH